MLPTPSSQEAKLKLLKGKRKPLSVRFDGDPKNTRLALELKTIDDQIAECNQEIQGDRRKQK